MNILTTFCLFKKKNGTFMLGLFPFIYMKILLIKKDHLVLSITPKILPKFSN